MYNYQHTISYLQSTTFAFACLCMDEGKAIDLTDYTITAKIRDSRQRLITDVVVTKLDDGLLHFTLAEGVKLPVKTLYIDVRLSKDTIDYVTQYRIRILVERVVTDD